MDYLLRGGNVVDGIVGNSPTLSLRELCNPLPGSLQCRVEIRVYLALSQVQMYQVDDQVVV